MCLDVADTVDGIHPGIVNGIHPGIVNVTDTVDGIHPGIVDVTDTVDGIHPGFVDITDTVDGIHPGIVDILILLHCCYNPYSFNYCTESEKCVIILLMSISISSLLV